MDDPGKQQSPTRLLLSVVIPSYRSGRTLTAVLDALDRETRPLDLEILVVDSTGDGAAEAIARSHPRTVVIASAVRLSCGAARNLGAARARGDYLLFLDADCVPENGWGRHLAAAVEGGADIQSGAIANGTPASWSGSLQFWIEFSRFHPFSRPDHHFFLPSFQLLVRRGLFLSLPPYPEDFLVAEDLVFFTRLRETGHTLRFNSAMVVRHLNRESFRIVLRHLFGLGAGSGRARALYPGIRGKWFRRFPIAVPLLFPYSWLGLAARLGRTPGLPAWKRGVLLALAVPGLAVWHTGFAVGLFFPRAWCLPPAPALQEAAEPAAHKKSSSS
jgi:glycosyltransferase involved in cell wall biosynthesis